MSSEHLSPVVYGYVTIGQHEIIQCHSDINYHPYIRGAYINVLTAYENSKMYMNEIFQLIQLLNIT